MAKRTWWLAGLRRGLLFALLWWALTEGDLYGWPFGLAMVALATYASLILLPPPRWRLRWQALPAFVLFFLHHAVLGGVDVARRAFDPRLPINPAFLRRPLGLKPLAARLIMTWTVSLLPGTVSVELGDDELELHVLDTHMPTERVLAALEERIGALFA